VKISRITIENFRQHRNLQIELNASNSSFTVIKGRNGAGKTNLLKAITWALTGSLAKDENKFDVNTLVSFGTANDAKKGDKIEVLVKLDLDLGSLGMAQIIRTARFVKSGEQLTDLSYSASELSVLTLEDKSKGYQKEPSPDIWIEKVFPERFSHYFLFDGEHLHRFFKDTEAAHVKRAVLEIANIDQLEKIVDHLTTVNQQLVKEAGSVSGVRGEELRKDYELVEEKISKIKIELEQKDKSRLELEEELTKVREKMGDIAAIKKDIQLRNQLDEIAQSASVRGQNAKKELGAWAFTVGPALMLKRQFDALQLEIDKAKQNKVLPPPYKPEALTELLRDHVCICGRDLPADSDPCREVERLLAQFTDLSVIGETLSDLQQPLQLMNARIESSGSTLKSAQERIQASISDEKDAMEKLAVLQQKLAGNDDSQIAFISNKHDDVKRDVDNLLMQIGSLQGQLLDNEERLVAIRKNIEVEAASKEKSKNAYKRQKFAEATLATAQSMYKNFSDEVRASVATSLNDEFQSMIWKKNFFNPVQIDEEYRVLVSPKKFDIELRNALSAGETACLAFAFALTLSNVAGFSYPMVVDSPLGRLDSEVKEFVSSVLAKALESGAGEEGKQILLLMTDSEYNAEVADAIAHMKPKVMEIVFDQENIETKLELLK
jgi:DNA sulfur modification protein DndD